MPHLKIFLIAGAAFAATGVLLGAFGAHALSSHLTSTSLHAWETAVNYQLSHAMALLIVGIWGLQVEVNAHPPTPIIVAGWSFLSGIVLFSGSLYALALNGPSQLGPVTPIGGVAFIIGWVTLIGAALRR
ncbi:MAG: DUF423 domain-containing protein [Gammaproteobacteria bacterium]|nr:MAG: DUF423 domain-containing protein [Gammaproteobacteria bacterium]TDJ35044.1 MAG: DUF423 domain-containing protein [Gammaproteobacteria bacterium]